MSRLMTGILLVALLGLTISMAWAQGGTAGFGESKYTAGPPAAYDAANPNGFPVAAEATFKATVLNYGQVSITPPADLTIPGDAAGVAGVASIDYDEPGAGKIAVQANTTCNMAVEVTEFKGDTVGEEIWTEIQLGVLEGRDFLPWMPADPQPPNSTLWRQVSTADEDWYGFGQANVSKGVEGTIILTRAMDPVNDFARYWQIPFGVRAKNRTYNATLGIGGRQAGYNTLALAQNYTATMYVTLTKP